MDSLTASELKVLDNLSHEHEPSVHLGDLLQSVIDHIPSTGTPVNAVEATMDFALTGVVIDGETVTVGTDVYEFMTDTAQTKTASTNIGVNIAANATKSSGTLTMDTQPTSGDTVTIGAKTYIFVPVGTANADGEVSIGANLAGAQANLVAAINGTDNVNTAHTLVTAGNFAANASTITAKIGGTVGDAIPTTETFTAETNAFGGATLGSGANCTATNAAIALTAAITASDTQGVGATRNTAVVTLTADVPGVAGNSIALAKTTANGAFTDNATHLAGGVDGTVGVAQKVLIDSSYIYVATVANSKTGKNWKKAALSSL